MSPTNAGGIWYVPLAPSCRLCAADFRSTSSSCALYDMQPAASRDSIHPRYLYTSVAGTLTVPSSLRSSCATSATASAFTTTQSAPSASGTTSPSCNNHTVFAGPTFINTRRASSCGPNVAKMMLAPRLFLAKNRESSAKLADTIRNS